MNAPELRAVGDLDRRDIPGLEGYYQASRDGRIYSVRRGRWLAPASNRGYLVVTICIDGRQKVCKVHRLVALAWIPNPDALPEVNHLDGRKDHNAVENLEWSNASRQQYHARALGLIKTTDAMRAASARNIARVGKLRRKLTVDDVAAVRIAIARGESQRELARHYQVSPSAIHAIWKGKTYAE